MSDNTDSTIQAESGGDPTAHNARSSAAGLGQFIDPTWLATVKAHAPDVAAGKSDDEILALKNDPTLAAQPQNMQLAKNMTGAYASDNQAILSKAGLPVTPGTTYLAHFAGPGGAVKVLQADPGADVGGILGPAAVAANPFLKGMTAQGLQSWAAGRVGATSPRVAAGAPGTPAAPPAPPAAAPIFAGAAPPVAAYQDPAAPPIQPLFAAQHKPIDLSGLRAALAARQGPIFANSQS